MGINGILSTLGLRLRIGKSRLGPLALTGIVVPSSFTEHVEQVAYEMYKCQLQLSPNGSLLSYFQGNTLMIRMAVEQFERAHTIWQGRSIVILR